MLDRLFGDRQLRQKLTELQALHEALQAERNQLAQELEQVKQERDGLRAQVETLQQELSQTRAKLEEAQRGQKRPDGPFRRPQRKRNPKKPGRPAGHAPAGRNKPPEVDEDIRVPLTCCPHCGGQDLCDIKDLDPQIVIDVPEPVRPTVRRYHNQSGFCQGCKKRVVSRDKGQHSSARGAAGVQVGPRALALALDLRHGVGLPLRKVSLVLQMLTGLEVSPAALVRMGERVAARCEPTVEALVHQLRQADVVHGDETGWYVIFAPGKAWLWVFAAPEPKITVYRICLSRGIEVPLEVLGQEFVGTLGIDGWVAYLNLPYDKGQCIAHLLRRCRSLLEVNKQGAARFPQQVQRALGEALQVKALQGQIDPGDYAALVQQVQGRMAGLLQGQIQEPLNLKFQKHLLNHQHELFTFLDVPLLTPSNNLAEREIRPAVILRKVSTGNRSLEGAYVQEILTTISRTAQRNGLRLAQVLPDLLRSLDPNQILPLLPIWRAPRPPPS